MPARFSAVTACFLAAAAAGGEEPAGPVDLSGAFTDVAAEPGAAAYSLPVGKNPGEDAGDGGARAVALIFVGHDCPVSNGYAPEIKRICAAYEPKGVAVCLVYADADLPEAAARKHAADYGFACPALRDPAQTLARRVGATVMPEAVVLSPAGDLRYRGRIDDLYAGFGRKRREPTVRDLRRALDAVLAGTPVPAPRTTAVGCYIHFPKDGG